MSLLEKAEAQVLLNDANVTADTVRGCADRLTGFLQRVAVHVPFVSVSAWGNPASAGRPVVWHRRPSLLASVGVLRSLALPLGSRHVGFDDFPAVASLASASATRSAHAHASAFWTPGPLRRLLLHRITQLPDADANNDGVGFPSHQLPTASRKKRYTDWLCCTHVAITVQIRSQN